MCVPTYMNICTHIHVHHIHTYAKHNEYPSYMPASVDWK